jgi:hypothetical protein
MGTSYVEFRGKGFWSWDGYLEDVLRFLAETAVDCDDPTWLTTARQHWLTQSSGVFNGWIHPNLDELLTTAERQSAFLRLTNAVSARDDVTPEARETLRLIVALVRGEVTTDASSPLEYIALVPSADTHS